MTRLERKRLREKQRRDEFSTTFNMLLNVLLEVDNDFAREAKIRETRRRSVHIAAIGARHQDAAAASDEGNSSNPRKRKAADATTGADSNDNTLFSRVELVVKATEILHKLHGQVANLSKAIKSSTEESSTPRGGESSSETERADTAESSSSPDKHEEVSCFRCLQCHSQPGSHFNDRIGKC